MNEISNMDDEELENKIRALKLENKIRSLELFEYFYDKNNLTKYQRFPNSIHVQEEFEFGDGLIDSVIIPVDDSFFNDGK
jgi:hypothetical protein